MNNEITIIEKPNIEKREEERTAQQQGQSNIIPTLDMDDITIYRNEGFSERGVISGEYTKLYVEGFLRGWYYNDSVKGQLDIIGDAVDTDNVENGILEVIVEYLTQGQKTEVSYEVGYSVVERPPIIINPGTIKFYKDVPANLLVEIQRNPSAVSASGLLAKLNYSLFFDELERTYCHIFGDPNREVLLSENRRININALTSGGIDEESFLFEISDSSPPSVSLSVRNISQTTAIISLSNVSGAMSYEYRIGEEGEYVNLGTSRSFTLSQLEPSTRYNVFARVGSPWIGTAVSRSFTTATPPTPPNPNRPTWKTSITTVFTNLSPGDRIYSRMNGFVNNPSGELFRITFENDQYINVQSTSRPGIQTIYFVSISLGTPPGTYTRTATVSNSQGSDSFTFQFTVV